MKGVCMYACVWGSFQRKPMRSSCDCGGPDINNAQISSYKHFIVLWCGVAALQTVSHTSSWTTHRGHNSSLLVYPPPASQNFILFSKNHLSRSLSHRSIMICPVEKLLPAHIYFNILSTKKQKTVTLGFVYQFISKKKVCKPFCRPYQTKQCLELQTFC